MAAVPDWNRKYVWTTAEESEMKSFGLMYSGDGISFRKLADIRPKGKP